MSKSKIVVRDRFSCERGPVVVFTGPGRTHQEFKDECDINLIMSRALKTGTIPSRSDMGRFGDFSTITDFHDAQNTILKSNEQFAALPSKVRDRFANDPAKFLSFIHSKDTKLEELHDMGLLSEEASERIVAKKNASVVVDAAKP